MPDSISFGESSRPRWASEPAEVLGVNRRGVLVPIGTTTV